MDDWLRRRETADAALQMLTVGSLSGRLGLARADVSEKLLLYPAFYAARGLAELAQNPRYQCHSSQPRDIAAIAGMDREGKRVAWLANLTGRKQEVVLEGDLSIHSVFLLDERNLYGSHREWQGSGPIQLLPFAVACLRFGPQVI